MTWTGPTWYPEGEGVFGQIELQTPIAQDHPMFHRKFPQDILGVIYRFAEGPQILQTCRSAYKAFLPFAKFVDVHALRSVGSSHFCDPF